MSFINSFNNIMNGLVAKGMSQTISVQSGCSLMISNGEIWVNGKKLGTKEMPAIIIKVEGNPADIKVDVGAVEVAGTVQSIRTTSGDVKCGNVNQEVHTVSGDIDAGDVGGNTQTVSGDVRCRSIKGNCSTLSGDIN